MADDSKPVTVPADALLAQVRAKMRRERLLGPQAGAVRFYSGPVRNWGKALAAETVSPTEMPEDGSSDLSEMAELVNRLNALDAGLDSDLAAAIRALGEVPPAVTTVRSKVGRALILLLKRLLWWHTWSLKAFADSAGKQFECELAALELLAVQHKDVLAQVAALQEDVRQLRQSMLAKTEVGSQ
ncbi:MAG: hypothetical protein ABSB23_05550 [Bryobacteraceae bacterium]|jgi:hypothetical protein